MQHKIAEKMRLLVLVEGFTTGGAQRMVYEEIKNIDQNDIKLLVVCYQNKKNTDLERAVEQITDVQYLGIEGLVNLFDFFRVFRAIQTFKPDIVHTHLTGQVFAIPWSILYRKPVVITAHTKPEQAFVKKVEFLLRFGLKYGKIYVVAVSENNLEKLQHYFKEADFKLCFINNGISIDDFYQKEHVIFTFINVARQDENKNQILILKCFADLYQQYGKMRLLLIGDGPKHKELLEKVKEMHLEDVVDLPGNVSNVKDYYAISDVYVQSSHREAMPMSVLEALAAKLPVIATNVGGLSDVIKGNGILVEDGNQNEMVKAMEWMLRIDQETRKHLGEQSFEIVKRYSSSNMTKEYVDLFEKIKDKC